MSGRKDTPIRSTRAFDPELEEELDRFVLGLGEWIDGIQEAERARDYACAERECLRLAAEAERFGLPPLAEAAQRAAEACSRRDAERAYQQILELTDVVRRVRIGHRIVV